MFKTCGRSTLYLFYFSHSNVPRFATKTLKMAGRGRRRRRRRRRA